MADNTLIIGSAPKYRGEYSDLVTYYKDNIVTSYGSVFKAASNLFSDVPPIEVNQDGTVSLTNNGNWTCIIDNTSLYNATLSTNNLATRVENLEDDLDSLAGNVRKFVILTSSEYQELVDSGRIENDTIYLVTSN